MFPQVPHVVSAWAQLGAKLSPKGAKLPHVRTDVGVHVHEMASIWSPSGSLLAQLQPNMTKLAPTWAAVGPGVPRSDSNTIKHINQYEYTPSWSRKEFPKFKNGEYHPRKLTDVKSTFWASCSYFLIIHQLRIKFRNTLGPELVVLHGHTLARQTVQVNDQLAVLGFVHQISGQILQTSQTNKQKRTMAARDAAPQLDRTYRKCMIYQEMTRTMGKHICGSTKDMCNILL